MITDEEQHKNAKRPIADAYAMTTLLDYEPFVDSTSQTLVDQLTTKYADTGRRCDFGEWLQWYAFDVIGEMTFSQRFGFLESQRDVGNIMGSLDSAGAYLATIGQMPWLDYLLAKNRFWGSFFSGYTSSVSKFVMKFLKPRIDEAEAERLCSQSDEQKKLSATVRDRKDFTAKFLSAFETNHDRVAQSQLLGWSLSNINAGSDTTAITLRAIFC
jgi:hypothetical protein